MSVSQSLISPAAGRIVPAAAPAMLERHGPALRKYLGQLPEADARRVEEVMQAVAREIANQSEIDDDPLVWLFARARLQLMGAGQRGEALFADEKDTTEGDETIEDGRVAVHRAFGRLTGKQQEVLRLKFQFAFNHEEIARITGLSPSGVSGLMHTAVGRIVSALTAGPGKAGIRISDQRILRYAMDEMEADEKKSFVASVADGKELLVTSEAVRRASRELKQLLESGAPPPKRQRNKGGVFTWTRRLMGILALLLIGGGFWWWSNRSDPTDRSEDRATSSDNMQVQENTHGIAPAFSSMENNPEPGARFGSSRKLRPGEAEWERKAFGRGNGKSPRETGSDPEVDVAANRETGPVMTGRENGAVPVREVALAGAPEAAQREPKPAPDDDDDQAGIIMPASGLGGAGVGADQFKPAKSGGPGAAAGSTMVQAQVGFKGPVPEGYAQKKPVVKTKPVTGLPDLKRVLARRDWSGLKKFRTSELLRQVPPERPAPLSAKGPLAVQMEMAPSPFTPGRQILRVEIRARPGPPPSRPSANVVLAIDVSASMQAPNRLPLVQEGVRLLAERLRPDDRIALVTYAAEARELRPSKSIGENGRELRDALNALVPEGRTNGYEGLTLAYATARKAKSASGLNAVILCTDGNFNLGKTDGSALAEMAAQAAADGIVLSVFGFGRSDRNDLRLEMLAQQGGGRSCYVNTREEAERLLAGQINGLLESVVTDVVWHVALDPEQVVEAKFLGGQNEEPAGELLPGRKLTALYELSLRQSDLAETTGLGEVQVLFRTIDGRPDYHKQSLDRAGTDMAKTEPGFRFAVAMSELGRIFHGEAAAAGPALERLEAWVRLNLPEDDGGYRRDLLDTIAMARQVAAP